VVPAETLSLKPKPLRMAQAAAIGVPYITAWASIVSAAQVQPGETILIVGARGAVGQAATQIANWKRARFIRSDSRHRVGRQYRDRRSSRQGPRPDSR
jgi:NADPH2:quinone reductase